jgi:hypothetical protein
MTAASNITEKIYNMNGVIPVVGRFLKAATADWITLGDYPGVINLRGTLYTGADEATLSWGTALIDNAAGSAYTATTTSIVIKSGVITRSAIPYYVQTSSGEIIMVMTDSAVGSAGATLTIKRGCLGTTASATGLADGNTLYIRNIVVFGAATTGYVGFEFLPMPSDPGTKLYYTDGS